MRRPNDRFQWMEESIAFIETFGDMACGKIALMDEYRS